jgi:hypothetical protein
MAFFTAFTALAISSDHPYIAMVEFVFSLGAFALVYGLWNLKPWARWGSVIIYGLAIIIKMIEFKFFEFDDEVDDSEQVNDIFGKNGISLFSLSLFVVVFILAYHRKHFFQDLNISINEVDSNKLRSD